MDLARDFRYAARSLGKNSGFALTAILTIALGIGASAAVFSVVNAVLLQPLPYSDSARLVHVWPDLQRRNVVDFAHPPGDLQDLRQQCRLFEGFEAINLTSRQVFGDADTEPQLIPVAGVTPGFFRLLGGRVVEGRDFLEEDGAALPPPPAAPPPPAQPGKSASRPQATPAPPPPPPPPPKAILSYETWQRRFGGDRAVIGRTIALGNGRVEVVGVLASGFEMLYPPGIGVERRPEVWTVMRLDFVNSSRANVFLHILGRLRPGVTLAQAQSEVEGVAVDLRRRFPVKESAGLHFRLEGIGEDLVADVRQGILALLGAVMFVLLIACANVANLLLVRSAVRQRELAIRAALGASAGRIVRQLLAESLLIAAGGALLGLVLARWGISLLLALKPANLPRVDDVALNPMVVGFAALCAAASAMIFGLTPAVRAARPNLMEILRRSGQTPGLAGGRWIRNTVVVAEVALCFVLLIGAGLMVRSFIALQRANPGYDPQNVLTFFLPNVRARSGEEFRAFASQLRARIGALPGVQSFTGGTVMPLDGSTPLVRWGTQEVLADPNLFKQCMYYQVLPGYFETLRTRVIEGRTFNEADLRPPVSAEPGAAPPLPVVIVDRLLAAKAFPGQSAVGQRILMRPVRETPDWYEIVGVVEHQRHARLSADGREGAYVPGAGARWLARTAGDPALLASAVRAEIKAINPLIPIGDLQPMTWFVERAQAPTRFALTLIGVFAGIAALLAAVGLYSVLSTGVRQRTAEIGVRMAFGAPPESILRLILRHGLGLSAAGLAAGLAAALALTRVMTTLLVDVQPTDPATFAVMAAVFAVIAAVACWLPARRAAALDPLLALREE